MSPGPELLLCQGGAHFECVEDDAGELSFEAAESLALALAFAAFAFEIRACGRVAARLRDRYSVECGVDLSVAAAVEPVALVLHRACFERRDAAVPTESLPATGHRHDAENDSEFGNDP
jgi:hypothetical protein